MLLSILTLSIIFPISFKSATPVEGIAKSANPSTLSFTASSTSAAASFNVTSSSGSSATSTTNSAFTLSTNNATGYTLRLKTTGGDTLIDSTNSDTTTNRIDPISTNGITLEQFSNNTWGLLPSKYNGTNNTTNYYKPTTTGFKMDETTEPNSSTANSYTIGLGIKADYTRPAGTYTNTTIVAEYVANPVSYAIYYNSNTTATVTGMPSSNPQSGTIQDPTVAQTVTLAGAPTRTGYTFSGWCLGTSSSSNITTTGGVDSCSSAVYTASESFGVDATKSPDNYYLYAMWTGNEHTATIYYKGASSVTSSNATKCRISSVEGTSCNATIDSTVRNSTGTNGNAYAGIATTTGSMSPVNSGTTITLSNSGTYYAFYRTSVTNYYYTGSAYSSRTLYRNQTLSSTSAMGTTYLATSSTGLSNYSTAGGPNSSTWYGLSIALNNTTRTYSSVANAAASTSTTLNSIYQFTQNFSTTGSTGVSSIGSTVQYCYVSSTGNTAGGTSCSVTTPTITTSTGYTSLGWGTQGHTSAGTGAGASLTVSTSGGTLYANAKLNTYNLVITGSTNVSAISVKKGSTSGTSTTCTKSGTTFTCSSLDYGTNYYLYPTFNSGYEFSSWTKTDSTTGSALGSTNTENTYYKVGTGNGSLTLASKQSKLWFQNATSAQCGQTMYDNRGTNAYKNIAYSTANAIGLCWMTRNLDLPGGTTLTSSDSNVTANYTLPNSDSNGFLITIQHMFTILEARIVLLLKHVIHIIHT